MSPDSKPHIQKYLCIPDVHLPYHDRRSFAAVEAMMKDVRFDGWICLGDLLDFNCISSHNIGNLRQVEGQRILADYKVANEFLDRHQEIIRKNNPSAKFCLIEGNHDERILRYIDAHPQLEGMIEVEIALRLKERNIEWVRYWSEGTVKKIGKATFIHGKYTNDGHPKKHVMRFGSDVFYGHTHSIDSYSLEQHGRTIVGQSLGCMCLPQKYMKGAPDKWQQCVAIFFIEPSGEYQYQIIKIHDHRFSYNDKVYKG